MQISRRSSFKNTKEKYTSELPSDCAQHYNFFNIYYEDDDGIYQYAVKSSYEPSLHDISKDYQETGKK